jgi:hypothetical protein
LKSINKTFLSEWDIDKSNATFTILSERDIDKGTFTILSEWDIDKNNEKLPRPERTGYRQKERNIYLS